MPDKNNFYRLTPRAEADLEEIWLYTFRNWSLDQADHYHESIVEVFKDLAAGRKAGRPVDIREGYFKYPAGSHIVFFRETDAGIAIIRILHRRMDVSLHL